MTGSWRPGDIEPVVKHDHVILHFASGRRLVFNDPRRFGVLDLINKDSLAKNRWLKHLGVEPLEELFKAAFLFEKTRKRKGPIKGFLMDQRQVVGVGNIYASEALFAARVKPSRPAGRVTQAECELLVKHIQRILREAIRMGGSTIRDYRNSEGEDGRFQQRFLVYDRAGEPCRVCASPLKAKFIAGRNTYWCAHCQR
jgi:formamidopyrimidine-DNA glycosylase